MSVESEPSEFIGISVAPMPADPNFHSSVRELYSCIQRRLDLYLDDRSARHEEQLRAAVQKMGAYLQADYETLWRLSQQEVEWTTQELAASQALLTETVSKLNELKKKPRVQFAVPPTPSPPPGAPVAIASALDIRPTVLVPEPTRIVRSNSAETLDPASRSSSEDNLAGLRAPCCPVEAPPLFKEPSPATAASQSRPFRLGAPPPSYEDTAEPVIWALPPPASVARLTHLDSPV